MEQYNYDPILTSLLCRLFIFFCYCQPPKLSRYSLILCWKLRPKSKRQDPILECRVLVPSLEVDFWVHFWDWIPGFIFGSRFLVPFLELIYGPILENRFPIPFLVWISDLIFECRFLVPFMRVDLWFHFREQIFSHIFKSRFWFNLYVLILSVL